MEGKVYRSNTEIKLKYLTTRRKTISNDKANDIPNDKANDKANGIYAERQGERQGETVWARLGGTV